MSQQIISGGVERRTDRRTFLQKMGLGAGFGFLAVTGRPGEGSPGARRYRAVVMGHTGRGDYGHDHDRVFNERPNIEVAAVADANPAGRAAAAGRCHASRLYGDYREMLAKERPDLACVALRWTDQHHAMIKAALEAGAHVYSEKPFTRTLGEADELLALAERTGRKIAVAHQIRLAPSTRFLKERIEAGAIGDLLGIRAHGKQDSRAGGEDMLVLGTHLFDLIRYLAGDAQWCTARVLQNGHEISRRDARRATEDIGPVAGDEIDAQFGFPGGVLVSYTSRGRYRETAGPWGLELVGSKGMIRVLTEIYPRLYLRRTGEWGGEGRTEEWRLMEGDPGPKTPASEQTFFRANRWVVDDWLAAIEENREPICSGRAAMKSLEMIMAVYEAGLRRTRVVLPLENREHPLGTI